VLANEACPCTTERVGSRSSTASVSLRLQKDCKIGWGLSSGPRQWRHTGTCRMSHVACWIGRLLKPRFMIEAKQPQSHVIRMFVECLLPLPMYVHGQTHIPLLGKSMVRGVVPQVRRSDKIVFLATGNPTSVRVWNRLMLLIYVEGNVPTL
jgi:hypothetical protein